MLRRAPYAVVAILVYVLVFAATAHAECAWVLWTEVNYQFLNRHYPGYANNKDYPTWKFDHNVHETRAACLLALNQEMDATVKSYTSTGAKLFQPPGEAPDFFVRLFDRKVVIFKQTVYMFSYEYACLPDTMDPRGPKGK